MVDKLQKIVHHIHPSTSTQRNAFVQFTAVFNQVFVTKYNEPVKTGPHVELVRKTLRADAGRVVQLISEKED